MLVTFKSTSYADITMFGEVAEKLLKMMGQSGNVPGAITADAVPTALHALTAQLSALDSHAGDNSNNSDDGRDNYGDGDGDGDAPISLATRAQPLIQLLEASVAGSTDVLWEH